MMNNSICYHNQAFFKTLNEFDAFRVFLCQLKTHYCFYGLRDYIRKTYNNNITYKEECG